jgi:hypothetical protein
VQPDPSLSTEIEPGVSVVACTTSFPPFVDASIARHAVRSRTTSAATCDSPGVMRPTLRIVDTADVGAIAGHVDSALVTDQCLPKVYVFSGAAVTPDDLEDASGADADPLVVAAVAVENGSTEYSYRAAFLPPGAYTVAFTCDDDDAATDDTLAFVGTQDVTVQTKLISTADFAAPTP